MSMDNKCKTPLQRIRYAEPHYRFEGIETRFHFAEMRYLIISNVRKHLFVEFKLQSPVAHAKLRTLSDFLTLQLRKQFLLDLELRQAAYNGTNIIELYLNVTSSPKRDRKKVQTSVDSGMTSNPETSSDIEFASSKSSSVERTIETKETGKITTSTIDDIKPRTGELYRSTFNGNSTILPTVRTSSGTQTQSDVTPRPPPSNYKAVPLVYDDATTHRRMLKAKLSDNTVFNRVRDYLAYFESNRDITFEGETYFSIKNLLINDGLNLSDHDLSKLYLEMMLERGFSEHEVFHDIRLRKRYMHAKRLAYVIRTESTIYARNKTVRPAPTGTCDPECCIIA